MTDGERRVMLALLDAAERDFAAELADPSPAPASPRFRRQMRAMLADPNGWARRRARPAWQRAGRLAASVLLACTLTFGALLAASPTIRAAVVRWVTEWYETYVVYRFNGEQEHGEMPRYVIGDLPEGYAPTGDVVEFPGYVAIDYQNAEGLYLRLDYMRMQEGAATVIDTEGMEVRDVTVSGWKGHVYLSLDGSTSNGIIWMDEERNLTFTVDGFLDELDLLHIAESVCLDDSTT